MDFQELDKQYRGFLAPRFEIMLEGSDLVREGAVIASVSVELSLAEAGYFAFTIEDVFDPVRQELKWTEKLAFGKKVEVKLGYADRLTPMLTGLITSLSVDYPEGAPPRLTVSGYDSFYLMMKGMEARSWDKIKHSEIVAAVSQEYKLTAETEDTSVTHPKIVKQEGVSDYQFLRSIADEYYFEFFLSGKKLIFKPPATKTEPVVALEWRKQLLSFQPDVNLTGQVSEVEVRGWDPKEKKQIVGKAAAGDEWEAQTAGGRKSGSEYASQLHGRKVTETIRRPVYSQAEADRLARSLLNKRAEGLVTGSGGTIGIPDIVPGVRIALSGLGKMFSAAYYVEETVHSVGPSGYRTTFKVKGNTV